MGSSSGDAPAVATVIRSRLRQVGSALRRRQPCPLPDRFRRRLPANIVDAWHRLPPYDQHHLVAVARDLEASNQPDSVMLAGLLHDIGKTGRVTLADRVMRVVLGRLAPPLAGWLRSRQRPIPGLGGLHLLLRHAETGAHLLQTAGMPAEIVRLVRHHEDRTGDPALVALQSADRRH